MHRDIDMSSQSTTTLVCISCIVANSFNVAPAEGFRRDGLPKGGGGAKQRSGTVPSYRYRIHQRNYLDSQLLIDMFLVHPNLSLPRREWVGKTKLLTRIPHFAANASSSIKATDLSSQRMKSCATQFPLAQFPGNQGTFLGTEMFVVNTETMSSVRPHLHLYP